MKVWRFGCWAGGRAGGEGEDGSREGEWLARLVAARCLLRVGVGDGSSGG